MRYLFSIAFCALVIGAAAPAQDFPKKFGQRGGFAQRGQRQGMPDLKNLDIPPLLKKAIEAGPKLRYSGERILEFKRGAQRSAHTEYVVKDGDRLRITFPDDSEFAGQVIVEDENSREHFFPGRNEIEVMASRREETITRMIGLFGRGDKRQAKFVTGDPESVAGMRCTPVAVCDPRGNAFIRLWIEPRTGMVMKRELYDPSGASVGSQTFTRINFNPIVKRGDFALPMRVNGATRLTPVDLARKLMKSKGMVEAFLPPEEGYKLEGSRLMGSVEKPALMLFYRGPKGHLTLHQVNGAVDMNRLKGTARELHIYSWQVRGKTFALMGDLDESELKRIASRIKL